MCAATLLPATSSAQESTAPDQTDKRIFGVIPNNRTSPTLTDYEPLTVAEKFKVATADSFDRGTFLLAAGFAGNAQLTDSTPSYGHGVKAYARYYTAATGDLMIGNFMTEAVFPTALHQDPRYFRRGTGSGWARLRYAAGQIVWTHTDSGKGQFNFSEIVGNATAVGISNAYYPDNRNVSDNLLKFGMQVGVDMTGNILKEFSPDLRRLLSRGRAPRE